jgi:hypothetical protein
MKFSALALTAATCITSAAAEVYMTEDFNDDVRPDFLVCSFGKTSGAESTSYAVEVLHLLISFFFHFGFFAFLYVNQSMEMD